MELRSPVTSPSVKHPVQSGSWRIWLGIAFLGLQGVAFLHAKFHPTRYFCWAPFDQHCWYTISTSIGDRALSEAEIAKRYRIPATGGNPRSYTEITHTIEQYERTYGAGEGAKVRVRYSVNKVEQPEWTLGWNN